MAQGTGRTEFRQTCTCFVLDSEETKLRKWQSFHFFKKESFCFSQLSTKCFGVWLSQKWPKIGKGHHHHQNEQRPHRHHGDLLKNMFYQFSDVCSFYFTLSGLSVAGLHCKSICTFFLYTYINRTAKIMRIFDGPNRPFSLSRLVTETLTQAKSSRIEKESFLPLTGVLVRGGVRISNASDYSHILEPSLAAAISAWLPIRMNH